ncbi:nose resistant to fluoxetine protein 6-like [Hyposmocoma kahamanoa]|uniref:nose resistant to fluoxetine protein 6-like n=1 Tax=Hyposmocoma kahamanoa TaxID=1477025 RepID=UPI000E6D7B1C|nr:nose resistant to fluoxetine protein 6-like [Hyposmocoma kahamanoa]
MALKLVISFLVLGVSGTTAFRSAFDTDLYERVIDAELCQEQLTLLSNHSLRYRFYDASGKIPSGILQGNLNELGDYFQCLSIDEFVNNYDIKGKYCRVNIPLDQNPIELPVWPPGPIWPPTGPEENNIDKTESFANLQRATRTISGDGANNKAANSMLSSNLPTLNLAVCIPKVCSVRQALEYMQDQVPLLSLNLTFTENYCRLPNDKPLAPADFVAIGILSFIGLLLIISTSYDLYHIFVRKRDPSEANVLLRSFSVYTNTHRFLTFKSANGALECIDGIRAISMLWVVVGHTYFLTLYGHVHNYVDIINWMSAFSSTWVIAAPITVDTFFLLSGILVVYTTIGKVTRGRFIRCLHLFYLNRLLRMFPLLAAVILLQASLFHHMSDGPNWNVVAGSTERCREYWWSALLHVQNIVNYDAMCLGQTWYLSVDIQLYVICPLVLLWLFGSGRLAWFSLTAAIILSLISSSLYSFLYNFSAVLVNINRLAEVSSYVKYYYFNTLARAPPFFVGMLYGYIIHLYRDRKIRVAKVNLVLLWALSFLIMAFCIFSVYPVAQPSHDIQVLDNILNAYMRAMWACALGWLIFACVQGYGGPINWFLSLQMWKLPARLSYAMYLVHFPIMMVVNGSWLKTHYFSNGETMYRFMGELGFTTIAAFILCITIDAPFSVLQKLLLQGGSKRAPKKVPEIKVEFVEAVNEPNRFFKTVL